MDIEDRINHASQNTEVVRPPKQTLATFGVTVIDYYLVTEPVYAESSNGSDETVVRRGCVVAEKPRVVTPMYLMRLDGFGENAKRYFQELAQASPTMTGLYYSYRNEVKSIDIVSEPLATVVNRLNEVLDREGNPLATIIKGIDELWDVSLLKFITELTEQSVNSNIVEFGGRGLLGIDSSGGTKHGRYIIENLFKQAEVDVSRATELKQELDRWGFFYEYEDRFLDLFRKI
ncbi:MAG: hypothetical protein SVY53_02545 [Chloroflexota bacterium]|nr:hypothetical protein [Chloroflexota bacterium]